MLRGKLYKKFISLSFLTLLVGCSQASQLAYTGTTDFMDRCNPGGGEMMDQACTCAAGKLRAEGKEVDEPRIPVGEDNSAGNMIPSKFDIERAVEECRSEA